MAGGASLGPGYVGRSVSGRRAVMLICAGWLPQDGVFGWSVLACLRSSVDEVSPAHRGTAGCSSRCSSVRVPRDQVSGWASLQNGQGPAPAGQFPCDRCGRDGELLVPLVVGDPSTVQAQVADMAADPDRFG